MNIKDEIFLSTMFQVNVKTNFNIENLPSLSALIYQAAQLSQDKQLSRPQFVQIGTKYCGLKDEDALLIFELFCALYKAESAPPRVFVAFLFCCLFKSTVSSKRSKILADDLWPQQQQTFEAMVEQYVKTCSDILAAAMCIKNSNQNVQGLSALKIDQEGLLGLSFLLQSVPDNLKGKTALEVSTYITHNGFCNNQPTQPTETFQGKQVHFYNIKDKCLIYRFKQNVPVVKIYNCQHVVIFLLGQTSNIIISNCHNVKIIVTSCIGLVTLNSSRTVNLSAICKFCKVYHTDDLQLNINCFYGCLQDSQAQTVSQAPFNWIYESLEADLQQVGLQNLLTCYTQMRIVGALGLEWQEKVQPSGDFCTQIVPVGQISGKKLLVQLPEHFQTLVEKRVQRLKEFQTKLDSMNSDEKVQFEAEMKQQLLGWLQSNNMANEMGWISSAEIKDL